MEYIEGTEDDWECDINIPFVEFKPPDRGAHIMVIDKYIGSRTNKFGKTVFDFDVRICADPSKPTWRQHTLSVGSRRLRAEITRVKNLGLNEGKFFGNTPIEVEWEGEGQNRKYFVTPILDVVGDTLRKSLGLIRGPI